MDGKKIDSHIDRDAVKIFTKIKDKEIKHVLIHSDNKEDAKEYFKNETL